MSEGNDVRYRLVAIAVASGKQVCEFDFTSVEDLKKSLHLVHALGKNLVDGDITLKVVVFTRDERGNFVQDEERPLIIESPRLGRFWFKLVEMSEIQIGDTFMYVDDINEVQPGVYLALSCREEREDGPAFVRGTRIGVESQTNE